MQISFDNDQCLVSHPAIEINFCEISTTNYFARFESQWNIKRSSWMRFATSPCSHSNDGKNSRLDVVPEFELNKIVYKSFVTIIGVFIYIFD